MRKHIGALAAVIVGASLAGSANATVVHQNGQPIPGAGGPDLTFVEAAEMFRLDADTRLAGGAFYYSVAGAFRPAEGITYRIYSSTPNIYGQQIPGAVLASGLLSFTSYSPVPHVGNYGPHYRAEFDLPSLFAAQSGQDYWISLAAPASPERVSWVGSNFAGASRITRPDWAWQSYDYDLAFELRSAIPEPASWALMITGFGLTGTALRRRKRQIAGTVRIAI